MTSLEGGLVGELKLGRFAGSVLFEEFVLDSVWRGKIKLLGVNGLDDIHVPFPIID